MFILRDLRDLRGKSYLFFVGCGSAALGLCGELFLLNVLNDWNPSTVLGTGILNDLNPRNAVICGKYFFTINSKECKKRKRAQQELNERLFWRKRHETSTHYRHHRPGRLLPG